MKYGKIENYKIVGTCITQSENYPDEIPDDAELFDFLIDGVLYPASEYANKIPTVKSGKVTWIDDMDTLRSAKSLEISAAYISERTTTNKGITSAALGGAIIDCRESDVLDIQNLITLLEAQGATEYFYKLKDNSNVECTVAQIKTVLTELIAALLSMWQLKQTLTDQINSATTAEEIQAVKWEWPNK